MMEPVTVGRDEELKTLLANAKRGIPTLILGKSGLGKTHLLEQFMARLAKRGVKPVYLDRLWPFKPALLELYLALHGRKLSEKEQKSLKRLTVPELTKETLELLERIATKRKPLIILDRLEDAPATAADFLLRLSSLALVFGAAQYVKHTRVLRRFFWQFETLDLEPLSRQEALTLAERLSNERNLQIADPAFFLNQVVSHANGVPLAIQETITRLQANQPVSRAQIRELFLHGSGVREIDGTPLIILVFCLFIALRFIARGFSDYQAYAMFGALGAVGLFIRYLIFRQYFRRQAR
ncbi:MAG: ATP-binding protein [Candidatus Omnitrophica bacterium]|nr:ATP-binding protein [Candidatus Omnitrophota bacterium]